MSDTTAVTVEDYSVDISKSGLMCTCIPADVRTYCDHKQKVLNARADSVWFDDHLWQPAREDGLVGIGSLAVPLFNYGNASSSVSLYFYMSVDLEVKTGGSMTSARVVMSIPPYPAVGSEGILPGTRTAIGASYANLGLLLEGEGRKSIADSVAAWVGTQDAISRMTNVSVECDSYTHSGSTATNARMDRTSIILTGECVSCYTSRPNILDDVPSF